MTPAEVDHITAEVKRVYKRVTEHSEKAEWEAFLQHYDDSPEFLSISADGKMNTYAAFKELCSRYYSSLTAQRSGSLPDRKPIGC